VDSELLAPDPSEPLGLWSHTGRSLPAHPDLRTLAFEFSSRGDRVPGRVLLPSDGTAPFPTVLLQHGANGSKDASYMDAVAAPWARGGVAVASIDFPLHGERASAKVRGLLRQGLGLDPGGGALALGIAREFQRQAVLDLRRCVDALTAQGVVTPGRIAYAGLSLGAIVGACFCAVDPRPCAAVLALAGAGHGASDLDPGLDPCRYVGVIAPRPVLFVNATRDSVVSRERAERLHAAAGTPREVLWFDSGHSDLPGRALQAMWQFLHRQLLPEG
jgi:dienelactone hydrolase